VQTITSVSCKCHCGWRGCVGDCFPDVDEEGSLGCPMCLAVLTVTMRSWRLRRMLRQLKLVLKRNWR